MVEIKDKFLLEQMIFESIEYLEKNLKLATGGHNPTLKMRYQSGLAALDLLNQEYQQLTGNLYIPTERVLQYHSKQWERF